MLTHITTYVNKYVNSERLVLHCITPQNLYYIVLHCQSCLALNNIKQITQYQ